MVPSSRPICLVDSFKDTASHMLSLRHSISNPTVEVSGSLKPFNALKKQKRKDQDRSAGYVPAGQDHDSQSLKPDHGEPDSPSYTQLATLIAGDSDVHTSAKERQLQPNKPYTIRQIRKLLAGFKVQSSEKTSLMGAPPKELPGAATQRSKPHRDTFPTAPNAQEAKQTQYRRLSNSKPGSKRR
ncbi:hypothetical protein CSKR_202544 [Clonorchis sinensis]|uniref:Uncharacterized protein n=1 Tax=Clonorchis sinensis TaxID=79923 RepID=A0A8T1MTG7_CLOSI|nr:hypothetical protein CSKR_202544 [Clonorchis sinensis]